MKPWYQSKTVWFSIITAILAGLNAYAGEVKDPQQLNFILGCVAIGNVFLRVVTNQSIGHDSSK